MFCIELQVAEGANFPYCILGKAQLAISPFTDPWVWMDRETDPHILFDQEYGAEETDLGDVEDAWYDWLSQTISHSPQRGSPQYCTTPLLAIAQRILPEYLSRWPGIQNKLAKLLREAVSETDLLSIIQRNERLFGLSYPDDGEETIHFNLFPTLAEQKPGAHFVFGLGCLYQSERLADRIESEVGLTLLERILQDEGVCALSRRPETVTKNDRYVRGRGSVIEAVNSVLRAIDKHGDALTLDRIPQKLGEEGYWRIVKSLFRHRHLYPQIGLRDYVFISLDAIGVQRGKPISDGLWDA